jgi:hypothetical protein
MLVCALAYDFSSYYVGANAGGSSVSGTVTVGRPILGSQPTGIRGRSDLDSVGRPGFNFQSDAFVGDIETDAQKNVLSWRPTAGKVEAKLAPSAPRIVQAARPAQVGGAFNLLDAGAFGGLVSIAAMRPPPAAADLAKLLARMGADRQTRDALLGPYGALSASAVTQNLLGLGAVVQGVNDQPSVEEIADVDSTERTGPIQSYPLSAAALPNSKTGLGGTAGR